MKEYWKSYVFFARLEKQKEISQKLIKIIPKNIIYNFNYYYGELSKDHISFRIKSDIKFHNKIQNYLQDNRLPNKIQNYKDGEIAESYAMGTLLSQQFKSNLKKLEILDRKLNTKLYATILHGFLNNIVDDSCERKIYFRIWKALFKKGIYLKVKKFWRKIL